MVVQYYGRKADMPSIGEQCSLSREGVSLLAISQTAESLGLKTIGGEVSFNTLCQDVKISLIAHWDQNHFVIVYRSKKRWNEKYVIYIADPAKGLLEYDKDEFYKHWISTVTHNEEKGVVLLLEPSENSYREDRATASKYN